MDGGGRPSAQPVIGDELRSPGYQQESAVVSMVGPLPDSGSAYGFVFACVTMDTPAFRNASDTTVMGASRYRVSMK